MTPSRVSLLHGGALRRWSGRQVLELCALIYDVLRHGASAIGTVGVMVGLNHLFAGPPWSAMNFGHWMGLAVLGLLLFGVFQMVGAPLALRAIRPVLRLGRMERWVLERALSDPHALGVLLGGPLAIADYTLLLHLCRGVSPQVAAAWPLSFYQAVAQRYGPLLSIVRTFGPRLPAPVSGDAVPGLVAFALRSPDREDREWAIRWLGTRSGPEPARGLSMAG